MSLSTQLRRFACLLLLGLPIACAPTQQAVGEAPATRWDHRPEARQWTNATIAALQTQGEPLLETAPTDVTTYCPDYVKGSPSERAAFWAGMFSAIAKYESSWNPKATGPGGRYLGLMQISPETARAAGCDISTAGGLHDGSANLACAVKIAARQAPNPATPERVSEVLGDWGPMSNAEKRAEIAAWVRQQSYCK